MADVKIWSKKIKEDKVFAQGYKGLKSVKDILNKAKKDGYNITESELKDLNLKFVAGGDAPSTLPGMNAIPNQSNLPGMSAMPSDNGGASVGGQNISVNTNIDVNVQKVSENLSASNSSTIGNQSTYNFSVNGR